MDGKCLNFISEKEYMCAAFNYKTEKQVAAGVCIRTVIGKKELVAKIARSNEKAANEDTSLNGKRREGTLRIRNSQIFGQSFATMMTCFPQESGFPHSGTTSNDLSATASFHDNRI